MSTQFESQVRARPTQRVASWESAYSARIAISDTAVIIVMIAVSQFIWRALVLHDPSLTVSVGGIGVSYPAISIIIGLAWVGGLAAFGTRDTRVLGSGSAEYKRVLDASVLLFSLVAIIAFLAQIDVARGYILFTFPLGTVALLGSRWIWRQWLRGRRQAGQLASRVILFGSLESVTVTARELSRAPEAGYRVIAASVPPSYDSVPRHLLGTTIPIVSDGRDIIDAMGEFGCDTVIVTGSDELPAHRIREISWRLEPGRQHLVMAPSLTDVGGPRIHTRPVAGLPLIHVETPRYEGIKAFGKRAFDIVVSGVLILIASPVLIGVALAVKLTSPGPVLYRSERIGYRGAAFPMLKFRSMRVGADAELQRLLEEQGTAQTPLFKVQNDPRITPLGRVLRKYSLDELPQLFNVFLGSMSLVGPRPQIAAEVALYDDAATRRLLLKPGVSGLWQVSGRSALTWEDAIRLDLYYVENWSIMGDLVILWRTFKAVVDPGQTAH
ncbi:sugar transferase [Homoserinibacter sp. GY 40078]|uniref:sugar transferase n=1 Tax=Homoserinibacter sp. GY 40078 TaxID=2603275 RepID=UPI0011C94972|nr:sugar transferase [Homoserinibacter sp. GY 40078]TXK19502.1 sugar transferase [Homoserinibacter sp. GY 40078]